MDIDYVPGVYIMKRSNRGRCSWTAAEQLEPSRRTKHTQPEKSPYRKASPAPPLPESGHIPNLTASITTTTTPDTSFMWMASYGPLFM
jgi:hypothetical protein